MAIDAIGVVNGYQDPTGVVSRDPSKAMGQNDFLKLIVAELSNQDPMKAQDSKAMLENFMNLANYQASTTTTTTLESLKNQNGQIYASNLVGKRVEVKDANGNVDTGYVSKLVIGASNAYHLVVNGKEYTTDQVTSVLNETQPTTTASE
jgi:flagellar basal-body rod modification protein FlgD